MERKLAPLRKKKTDYQRMVKMLIEHDIKNLRQLLAVAARRGASPEELIARLQFAIDGKYQATGGYTQKELEVAFLVKALGGPRLLYALNHSHGLPSVRTVGRKFPTLQLHPCIGQPQPHEIDDNITSMFHPSVRPLPPLLSSGKPSGHTLMTDGIAINELCRYCAKRGAVAGLCREHASVVQSSWHIPTMEAIMKIEKDLFGEVRKCHVGKEATVWGVAPYARTD